MIYLKLFLTFLKIGAFTFGGGYAMLPLIQQEVIKNGWLSQEELIDFIAICESTPGPFAVNISTYVGNQTAGIPGAFCATIGVVLPSFIIILIIARIFEQFQKNKIVNGAMLGLKGAVVGLIGAAVISTARSVFLFESINIINAEIIISIVMFGVILYCLMKKANPIIMICASAVLGIFVKMAI